MILHHYDISPYSEMIRSMFGYTGLHWQSAISMPMPPRPIVDPLVGGYRRIPVAQIGADLFCDTKLIATEVASLVDDSALSYYACTDDVREFVNLTHDTVFMTVVQSVVPRSVLAMVATRYWPWQVIGLMKDRANVAKHSKAPKVRREQRQKTLDDWISSLEDRTTGSDFLFGDAPSLADFAAYHVCWFGDLTRPGKLLQGRQHALNWQARIQAYGQGKSQTLNKTQVFEAAKSATPRALDKADTTHEWVGKDVTIQPNDYAQDAVTGSLVCANSERWVLARTSDQLGVLHVHFPTHGYDITTNS